MSGTLRCNECNKGVAGTPALTLGKKGRLCVTCVDKFQSQTGTPSKASTFVEWYLTHKMPKTSEAKIKSLEEQLKKMQDLVDQLMKGEKK